MDDTLREVRAVNQAVDHAHERRDLAAMWLAAMWEVREHSDRVACIHPGWPILRTRPVVEDSWRRVFAGPGREPTISTKR